MCMKTEGDGRIKKVGGSGVSQRSVSVCAKVSPLWAGGLPGLCPPPPILGHGCGSGQDSHTQPTREQRSLLMEGQPQPQANTYNS